MQRKRAAAVIGLGEAVVQKRTAIVSGWKIAPGENVPAACHGIRLRQTAEPQNGIIQNRILSKDQFVGDIDGLMQRGCFLVRLRDVWRNVQPVPDTVELDEVPCMADRVMRWVARRAQTGDIQRAQEPFGGIGDAVAFCAAKHECTVGVVGVACCRVIQAVLREVVVDEKLFFIITQTFGLRGKRLGGQLAGCTGRGILRPIHAVGEHDLADKTCCLVVGIGDLAAEVEL